MVRNEHENFLLSDTLYDGQLLIRIPYSTYVDNSSSLKRINNQLFIDLAALCNSKFILRFKLKFEKILNTFISAL